MAPRSRFSKTREEVGIPESSFHLILLVTNIDGYKNLIKLLSAAYLEGFYYKPRIDKELLSQHAKGLIGMSACLKGEVPYLLSIGQPERARKALGE
ncbi:MAG: PHP domain-containing protein, partial [candidate division WOR-3 bacterium]